VGVLVLGGDFWFYTAVKPAFSVLTRKQSSTDGNISTVKQDVGGFPHRRSRRVDLRADDASALTC